MSTLVHTVVFLINRKDQVAGTGFLVSESLIVTCAHVLPKKQDTVNILWGPVGDSNLEQRRIAQVLTVNPDDDVAVLELSSPFDPPAKPQPLGNIPVIDQETPFLTYGAPRGFNKGAWGRGGIHGLIPNPNGKEPLLQLQSNQIDKGMSGAPVYDPAHGRIVGMISQIFTPFQDGRLADTVVAIRSETIQKYLPESIRFVFRTLILFPWLPSNVFVGRDDELMKLNNLFAKTRVAGVTGMVGIGKTQFLAQTAYYFRDRFRSGIYGIDASNGIDNGLRILAKQHFDSGDSYRRLLHGLIHKSDILLLLDDLTGIDELEHALNKGVLSQFAGSILFSIKSIPKNPNWPIIRLTSLSAAAAAQLFIKTVKEVRNSDLTLDEATINLICSSLGNQPLAIIIAAKQFASQELSLEFFHTMLQRDLVSLTGDSGQLRHLMTEQWRLLSEDAQYLLDLTGHFKRRTIEENSLELLFTAAYTNQAARDIFPEALLELKQAMVVTKLNIPEVVVHPLIAELVESRLIRSVIPGTAITHRLQQQEYLIENISNQLSFSQIDGIVQAYAYLVQEVAALLPNLVWQERLRILTLQALVETMQHERLSVSEQRRSALLLLQLRWLEELPETTPTVILHLIELVFRFAISEAEQHRLLQDVNQCLNGELTRKERIQFLTVKATLMGQIYQSLPPDKRETIDGQDVLEKARNTSQEALGLVQTLLDPSQRNQTNMYNAGDLNELYRISARAYLTAGNLESMRAETRPEQEATHLEEALHKLKQAQELAEAANIDVRLLVSVYRELSFNHGLNGEEEKSQDYHQLAETVMHERSVEIRDREVANWLWSLIYGHSAYLAWAAGKALETGSDGSPAQAGYQYQKAYDLTLKEIDYLEQNKHSMGLLINAYNNAGYYLQLVLASGTDINVDTSEGEVKQSPCPYWQKAFDWAQRYGYWTYLEDAQGYLNEHCQT